MGKILFCEFRPGIDGRLICKDPSDREGWVVPDRSETGPIDIGKRYLVEVIKTLPGEGKRLRFAKILVSTQELFKWFLPTLLSAAWHLGKNDFSNSWTVDIYDGYWGFVNVRLGNSRSRYGCYQSAYVTINPKSDSSLSFEVDTSDHVSLGVLVRVAARVAGPIADTRALMSRQQDVGRSVCR